MLPFNQKLPRIDEADSLDAIDQKCNSTETDLQLSKSPHELIDESPDHDNSSEVGLLRGNGSTNWLSKFKNRSSKNSATTRPKIVRQIQRQTRRFLRLVGISSDNEIVQGIQDEQIEPSHPIQRNNKSRIKLTSSAIGLRRGQHKQKEKIGHEALSNEEIDHFKPDRPH
jgi:hypothetical protein